MALVVGCGGPSRGNGTIDAGTDNADACVGLQCRVVDCEKQGMPPTSLSGTVYAPNGTLPLYGVNVYVPNLDPGPFPEGVHCEQCDPNLPGDPIVRTVSDESGHFQLDNVPAGTDIPLIITVGKWRRKVLLPAVNQCTDNALPATQTSLPKSQAEGDIPKIAISTGSCDALECLLRKLGVADSEFTTDTGTGRINMFNGNGASKLANNTAFTSSTALWGDLNMLERYDIVLLGCECSQNPSNKPQAAMDNIKAYADMGGRVFMSHYHNIWISGETGNATHAPAVWPSIAQCAADGFDQGDDTIDQVNNPHGTAFAAWMEAVGGSTSNGQISIQEGRQTCTSIDNAKAERWVYFPKNGTEYPQDFQFTTPNEMPAADRCGKVVFSDMHVASGSSSSSGTAFPGGCSSADMTPQEKALAFMLFDISSCVSVIQ